MAPPRNANQDVFAATTLAQQAIQEARSVKTMLEGHERLDQERHEGLQREIGSTHKMLEQQQEAADKWRHSFSENLQIVHSRVSDVKKGNRQILLTITGFAVLALIAIVFTRIGLPMP